MRPRVGHEVHSENSPALAAYDMGYRDYCVGSIGYPMTMLDRFLPEIQYPLNLLWNDYWQGHEDARMESGR